jgi:hypothetical protein
LNAERVVLVIADREFQARQRNFSREGVFRGNADVIEFHYSSPDLAQHRNRADECPLARCTLLSVGRAVLSHALDRSGR